MELKFKTAERLSHAYMISAPDMNDALSAAAEIAAAAVCMRGHDVPCGECRACRKAAEKIHPDITSLERIVDDKGQQKREITVDQIRGVAADAYVLPNEAERKVYIIKDADTMNIQAQNAALKLLEEPPKGVIFLLCVTNPELMLQTVRSRCVDLKCAGEAAQADPEIYKKGMEYMKQAAKKNRAELLKWCNENEDCESRKAAAIIDCALDIVADVLTGRTELNGLDRAELLHIAALLRQCREYFKANVGTKHIFGLLAADTVMTGSRGK